MAVSSATAAIFLSECGADTVFSTRWSCERRERAVTAACAAASPGILPPLPGREPPRLPGGEDVLLPAGCAAERMIVSEYRASALSVYSRSACQPAREQTNKRTDPPFYSMHP